MAETPDFKLWARYRTTDIVKERNWCGLDYWSAQIGRLPIPVTKPDNLWVQQRIVAEDLPTRLDMYVATTLPYFLQDGRTQAAIRDLLSDANDVAKENELAQIIIDVATDFMPRFCSTQVTNERVQAWYTENGFPEDPPVVRRYE